MVNIFNKSLSLLATRNYRILLILLIALLARFIPGVRTIDDAFITYRYAANLLDGFGFLYNPGQQAVLGTTTPLYTILLCIVGTIFGAKNASFPLIAIVLNALADTITCWILWKLGQHVHRERVGFAAALAWAIAPFSVTFAIGGLETSIYVMLLSITILAYCQNKKLLYALTGSFSLLTRPDALILLFPLMVDRLVRRVRTNDKIHSPEIIAFLFPIFAWVSFATIYFGTAIPHSIIAKYSAYSLPQTAALVRLIQHYATPFFAHNFLGSTAAILSGLILFPYLFIIGARFSMKTDYRLFAYAVYPCLYFIAFSIANPLIFRWYLTPPLVPYFFFIFLGVDDIINNICIHFGKYKHLINQWAGICLLFLLPFASTLSEWTLHPDHGPNRPAPEMAWTKLELLYTQAANYLSPYFEFDDLTLAAGDVGVLGFITTFEILDTVGLNSPISIDYYPLEEAAYVINYAIPSDLILDHQPDFLVILEVYGRETLLKNKIFLDKYSLINKLPTDIYGSDGMLIFQRSAIEK
jgi:hypothetical protein